MTRTVKQIPPPARIQIKENTRHNNAFLRQTGLEEIQPIINTPRQTLEIQPEIERAIRHLLLLDIEPYLSQTPHDIVALHLEVRLQSLHFVVHFIRLEHRDRGFLEGHIGPSIEIRAAGADCFDELFRPDDPGYSPAWETEAFGQTVDNEHVVLVNVDDVVCCADHRAIAVRGIVVPAVELVHDERCAVAAQVLDLRQLRVHHHLPSGVARVGRQDHGRAAR